MDELNFNISLLFSVGTNNTFFIGNTFMGEYIDIMVLYNKNGEIVAINADESRL